MAQLSLSGVEDNELLLLRILTKKSSNPVFVYAHKERQILYTDAVITNPGTDLTQVFFGEGGGIIPSEIQALEDVVSFHESVRASRVVFRGVGAAEALSELLTAYEPEVDEVEALVGRLKDVAPQYKELETVLRSVGRASMLEYESELSGW